MVTTELVGVSIDWDFGIASSRMVAVVGVED